MSILNLNKSQLEKISKKIGISVEELKKISSTLIEQTHISSEKTANSTKMQNPSNFYAIRLRSRATQLRLNQYFINNKKTSH